MVKKTLYKVSFHDKWGRMILQDILTAKNNEEAKKIFLRNRIKVKKLKSYNV